MRLKDARSAQLALILLVCATRAVAHGTGEVGPRLHWEWPVLIVIPLFLTALLYAAGVVRMARRSAAIRGWQILSFAGGWLSLVLALDSPIHELGEQLFSAHMTQHEILMIISAPLLVLSRPLVPCLWGLPESWRRGAAEISRNREFRSTWRTVSAPTAAWLLHALALWVWHIPVFFDSTLTSDAMHALQHVSFLGSALLFWWTLIHGHEGRLGYGSALLYVFSTTVHMSILGALLTFAPRTWYAPYTFTTQAWHLSPLEDQQLGGLIMWVPAGTVLVIISLVLLIKWMQQSDKRWSYTQAAAVLQPSTEVSHET
jgi:putative membrane protein